MSACLCVCVYVWICVAYENSLNILFVIRRKVLFGLCDVVQSVVRSIGWLVDLFKCSLVWVYEVQFLFFLFFWQFC